MVKYAFNGKTRRTIQGAAMLVALALAASMMAGCLTAQATAQSLQPAADAKAQSWDRSARLVVITGMEGGNAELIGQAAAMGGAEGDHWSRAQDDPEPGNGRAELWVYTYRNDDGEYLVVVVDRDRQILDELELPAFMDFPAIGHYQVDSDRAMQIAMKEHEGLRDARDGDGFGVMSTLVRPDVDDNPLWVIMGGYGSMPSGGGGMVILDALNGEVKASMGGWGHWGDWQDMDWDHDWDYDWGDHHPGSGWPSG